MENAITAGLAKQIVLARALDVAANNVANQTTTGFKAENVNFKEYLSVVGTPQGGDPFVSLVYDADSYTDFAPGGLQTTHATLDFAIDGDGFFALQTENGIRYTRDGHFGMNEFGELVSRDGDQVLDDAGAPILIDPEQGPLVVSPEGELQQEGIPVARIGVFTFDDNRSLRRTGANQFAADEDTLIAGRANLRQGFVELSNVSPVQSMTKMIEIMRAYENAAAVVDTSNELARNAVRSLTQDV